MVSHSYPWPVRSKSSGRIQGRFKDILKNIQGTRADRGVRGFFSRNTADCISAVTTTSTCGLTTIGCAAWEWEPTLVFATHHILSGEIPYTWKSLLSWNGCLDMKPRVNWSIMVNSLNVSKRRHENRRMSRENPVLPVNRAILHGPWPVYKVDYLVLGTLLSSFVLLNTKVVFCPYLRS